MPENALDAFTAGEEKLRAGQYEDALLQYLKVVRGVPSHWRSRFRIADSLLNLKAHRQAFEVYRNLGWHAVQSGFPLHGLVAIKMAAAFDRGQGELVHVIAQLYGRGSTRIHRSMPPLPPRKLKKTDDVGDVAFLKGTKLIEEAAKDAARTEDMGDYPTTVPAIPLFSHLEEDAFGGVLEGMKLRRYVKGQTIIQEGEPGTSFFILADGDVLVTRKTGPKVVSLARLHSGAVFGEMALIRKAPRTATVTAFDDSDLLELERGFLEAETQKLASVTKALQAFTHERFLANLAATSAVFKPLPRGIRAEVLRRFQETRVQPGELLIREGDEGRGLFLILKGQVGVTKMDGGREVALATLQTGDVFGEISLLQQSPTTATCKAITRAELLFLPRDAFHSTMARHPELKEELSKITAERIQKTKEALNPDDEDYILIEDDDLIML